MRNIKDVGDKEIAEVLFSIDSEAGALAESIFYMGFKFHERPVQEPKYIKDPMDREFYREFRTLERVGLQNYWLLFKLIWHLHKRLLAMESSATKED